MATFKQYDTQTGKRWHVYGYVGVNEATGKQVTINKRGFKTKKEAQLYFNRAKVDFSEGKTSTKNKDFTYQEVFNEWLLTYENTVKESTFVKTKKLFSNHILPIFAKYKIKKLSHKLIQEQVNEWHKRFAQYRKLFNYTSLVLKYAVNQEYIEKNPCDKVTLPTKEVDYGNHKKSKDFYNKEELKSFLKALDDYGYPSWKTFFRILAFTGLRRGEALALTWNDIDFTNGLLDVNKTLSEGENYIPVVQSPKTKSAKRTIKLDEITVNVLKHWKKEQAKLLIGFGFNAMKDGQLLFSKLKDNSHLNLSTPRNRLVNICKKYNIPMINLHGFRHTHASLLFEAGDTIKMVQERLGHSSISMTLDVYTHVTNDSKNKSAELFSNYVNF